jgi:hypothetical protein
MTENEIQLLISFNIPDNNQQLVTPSKVREVLNAILTYATNQQIVIPDDFQVVTDRGADTTKIITVGGMRIRVGVYRGNFNVPNLTDNRQWRLRDMDGTVAFLSDITSGGGVGDLQGVTENGNETDQGIVHVSEFGDKIKTYCSGPDLYSILGIDGISAYPIATIAKDSITLQNGPENLLLKAPTSGSGDYLFPATTSEEQVASREWASALLSNKADLVGGLVPASQLPGFVDDVLEFANSAAFPATGESGKLYVALDTNKTYRWSGSTYVALDEGVVLGETSSTAYRGDLGKMAYDHSQTSGNPHGTTAAQVGAYTQAQVDSGLGLKMDKTAWIDISTTSTIVGFSTFAQRFIFYKIIDNYIFIDFYIEGISNSPSFTFTSPFNNTSGASKFGSCGYNVNGGSPILNPARMIISNNSNIVNISLNFTGAAYTATGTKGCSGQISFKIN